MLVELRNAFATLFGALMSVLSLRRVVAGVGCAVVLLLVFFMLFTAGWDRPPVRGVQTGYRGSDQALIYNPRTVSKQLAATNFPVAPVAADPSGPRASEVFQNVQVLGNLSVGQFVRLMQGMADWVAPDQGCSYCHAAGNFASDALYTKRVARRMLIMTRQINTQWQPHVQNVGVTCYTCHRGNHVPPRVWSGVNANQVAGMMGEGQGHIPPSATDSTSLPPDAFSALLDQHQEIGVQGNTALPTGNKQTIKDTERTFALMIHMSTALGVNCSFCHNSRSFESWKPNDPHRMTALYGIRMVRDLNNQFMSPLASTFPSALKGPDGQPYKINCATCHEGVYKPLYGARLLSHYPELGVSNDDNKSPAQMTQPTATADQIPANRPASNPANRSGKPPVEQKSGTASAASEQPLDLALRGPHEH